MKASNARKEKDVMKLLMSNYEVTILDENNHNDLFVIFHGPKDSPYEGGIWKVHVLLPEQYPFKSPSIGFDNRMFHPNVDEASGTICLDVINQTWSPMYDLINIFDVFLPQLLLYPNPADPLNGEAAKLLQNDPEKYNVKIKEYVKKFAGQDLSIASKAKDSKSNENGEKAKEEIKSEASSELSKASLDDNNEDDDLD